MNHNRKYKAFVSILLIASLMLAFDRLTGGEWVTVTMAIFGLYMGGNVMQKRIQNGNKDD